jgi:hypothetical protein
MAITPVAIKDANSSSKNMAAYQDASSNNLPIHSEDSPVAHYRAATVQFTPVATPTVWAVIQGSASKTIRIKKIRVTGLATAAGTMDVTLNKRSSAGTAGSAVLTALTGVPLDSTNAAASAVISTVGTANYGTPGTLTGMIGAGRLCLTADGTGVNVTPVVWEFGFGDQALVLRGTSQFVTIDGNGDALPSGAKFDVEIEWAEDAS